MDMDYMCFYLNNVVHYYSLLFIVFSNRLTTCIADTHIYYWRNFTHHVVIYDTTIIVLILVYRMCNVTFYI